MSLKKSKPSSEAGMGTLIIGEETQLMPLPNMEDEGQDGLSELTSINNEHQESWRRLLQPPDYILMQGDLPSTSYGLTRGRQRLTAKYSHPGLRKSLDEMSDSSYHWLVRPPISSIGSSQSDDVFSISPIGGSVKMVQFDDLYIDSDCDKKQQKKRRRSSSKSDMKSSRDYLHKDKKDRKRSCSSMISTDSCGEKRTKTSISDYDTCLNESPIKKTSSGNAKERSVSFGSVGDLENQKSRTVSLGSVPDSECRREKLISFGSLPDSECPRERPVSFCSMADDLSVFTDDNQNHDEVKKSEPEKRKNRPDFMRRTSKKDEVVLVDTMLGSDDLKQLQEQEKSMSLDPIVIVYVFVMLFCCPMLGFSAVMLRIFSQKSRENGNFMKSARYRQAARWAAIVGMGLGTATGVIIFMYFWTVPFIRNLLLRVGLFM